MDELFDLIRIRDSDFPLLIGCEKQKRQWVPYIQKKGKDT